MVHRTGSFAFLPHELDYLIEPAMKYGVHQFDADVDSFLARATDSELEELARVVEHVRLNDHDDLIGCFLDDYPITDSAESANLYFLFGVIDAAGVAPADDSWNTVESRIKSLQQFGSYRLASERMHAAKALAAFGGAASGSAPHRCSSRRRPSRPRLGALCPSDNRGEAIGARTSDSRDARITQRPT